MKRKLAEWKETTLGHVAVQVHSGGEDQVQPSHSPPVHRLGRHTYSSVLGERMQLHSGGGELEAGALAVSTFPTPQIIK